MPEPQTALRITFSEDGISYRDLSVQLGDSLILMGKHVILGHFRKNGDAVGPTRIIQMVEVEVKNGS